MRGQRRRRRPSAPRSGDAPPAPSPGADAGGRRAVGRRHGRRRRRPPPRPVAAVAADRSGYRCRAGRDDAAGGGAPLRSLETSALEAAGGGRAAVADGRRRRRHRDDGDGGGRDAPSTTTRRRRSARRARSVERPRRRQVRPAPALASAAPAAPSAAAMAASRRPRRGGRTGSATARPHRPQLVDAGQQPGVGLDRGSLRRASPRRRGRRWPARRRGIGGGRLMVPRLDARGRWAGSRRGGGQRGPAPGDAGAHGAGRELEHRGDLGVVEVAHVAEHDGDAEVLRQLGEGGVEAQPIGDRGVHGGAGSARSARSSSGRPEAGSPPAAAQLVEAGVGVDAVGPRRERRAAVEAGEAAHDGDQRLLGGVGGVGVVAGDAPAQGVDPVVVDAQELVRAPPGRRSLAAATRSCRRARSRHRDLGDAAAARAAGRAARCRRDGDEQQHVAPGGGAEVEAGRRPAGRRAWTATGVPQPSSVAWVASLT